jgi:putative flippase GtrA
MSFRSFGLLVKHQAGAAAATLLDFGLMIGTVEVGLLRPVAATAVGAASGGIANFVLGRRWIFHARAGGLAPQALRYALVSIGSLVLNSVGVHVAIGPLGLRYVLARCIVAVLVGVGWNFPLHRYFVFRRSARGAST